MTEVRETCCRILEMLDASVCQVEGLENILKALQVPSSRVFVTVRVGHFYNTLELVDFKSPDQTENETTSIHRREWQGRSASKHA